MSDPAQKWRLAANFALYLVPFLAGALFLLGTVFLKADRFFARVYFADLVGAGLGGLVFLGTLFLLPPENLVVVPVLLALVGGVFWFVASRRGKVLRNIVMLAVVGAAAVVAHFLLPPALGLNTLAVSDYKGISYARKFPDSHLVYRNYSPFGDIAVYGSSYLHFAPGLSDNAAFNLPSIPPNAYLGLYVDGEGPSGIIRNLTANETAYFRFLPMVYPYLVAKDPRDLRDPVRRWHLDRRSIARRLEERHGRRVEPRHPLGLPDRQDAARLHRRCPERSAGPRDRLRWPALPRGPPEFL